MRSNGTVSTEEAKEEPKSSEAERGGVERPDVGVCGPRLDEAYDEPLMLAEEHPDERLLKLKSASSLKSTCMLHMDMSAWSILARGRCCVFCKGVEVQASMESSFALRREWRNSRWICIQETRRIVTKSAAPLGQDRRDDDQSGNSSIDIRGTEEEPQIGMCQSKAVDGTPRCNSPREQCLRRISSGTAPTTPSLAYCRDLQGSRPCGRSQVPHPRRQMHPNPRRCQCSSAAHAGTNRKPHMMCGLDTTDKIGNHPTRCAKQPGH